MRDYEEKSYYEIQLDNKQLILVFLAGVTVCVLVFILGVMVGKGRKEAEFAAASRNSESPAVRPEPDLEPPQEIQAVTPADNKNEKKKKEAQPKSEEIDNEYAYLENTDTERDLVKDPSKAKKEETKKEETKKEESKEEKTKVAAKVEPKVEPPKPEEKKPEPEVAKVDSGEPEPEPATGNGKYTVQVMATSSKPKAEAQLAALQSKGYTAFMNQETAAGNPVFKVRVGKFTDPDTARKTAARLKQELQLETWVAVLD